ncbi:MAG: energy transducer TonB [Methylocystis sp.]
MSESKFLGALYTAIAKRTPSESPAGEGEVTASFHVNAQGKIDRVTIDKTTSPALAEAVKKILSSVDAPPPPGGSMDVGQTFKFRAKSD